MHDVVSSESGSSSVEAHHDDVKGAGHVVLPAEHVPVFGLLIPGTFVYTHTRVSTRVFKSNFQSIVLAL